MSSSRPLVSILFVLAVLPISILVSAESQQQTVALVPSGIGKYNGPGGCAASNCHGGVQPKNITGIAQNEYSIWAAQDKHAGAFNVLSGRVSERMGKILQLEQPPSKSEKCLACHALFVSPELRATTFQVNDGVSCENCHGPAVGWLGSHTTKEWKNVKAEEKVRLGMWDTRDLVKRSEGCLTCHLGTKTKQVDHEMIAAGHPDLTFELNSFSAAMPRHWKTNREKQEPWFDAQELAVGQAVQLREGLNRLSRRASNPNWPEFAELDCFACHHSLTKAEDSWRQAGGYAGRRPGVPAWNSARYSVFRHFANAVNPQSSQQLDAALEAVSSLVNRWADARETAAAAQSASALVDQAARQLQGQRYDEHLVAQLMASIAGDGESIAAAGERSAEQAAMALESLSIAYAKNAKVANAEELRGAINKLYQQLNNPSAFNAAQFATQMRKVRTLLPARESASSRR